MLLKSNKLFPYPILWEEKDDYENNTSFKVNLAKNEIGNMTHLYFSVSLTNMKLLELINDDIAYIVCHIECAKTKYRTSFTLILGENEIEIPSNLLNGKVEIIVLIQNKVEIKEYVNQEFNSFYNGVKFDIPSYSIMAVSERYEVFIEKEIDNLTTVASFVSIIPSDDSSKKCKIECDKLDKIYIKLPKKSFDEYFKISAVEEYNSIIFSMLVVPALVEAFNFIIEQDDIEVMQDYRWFRGLSKVVKKIVNEDLTIEYLKNNKTNPYELAQALLDNPICKAFDKIGEAK